MQVTDAMGLVRHQPLQSRQQLAKVSVLASAFLLSVALGNVALRYIPVSFSQVNPCPKPHTLTFRGNSTLLLCRAGLSEGST